ncbi:MAG: sensor domain-containing protein [Haloarculaceae archaeon]
MTETVDAVESLPTSPRAALRWFFGVPLRVQTYANLLYLALTLPLGACYLAVLAVGLALGGSLLVVLVGAVVVLGLLYVLRELAAFERALADGLLTVDVPARESAPPAAPTESVVHVLTDLRTWTGVVYVASEFGLGVAVFVAMTLLSLTSLVLTLAPLSYQNVNIGVIPPGGAVSFSPTVVFELQTWEVGLTVPVRLTAWTVDSFGEALLLSTVGLLFAFVSLHLLNLLAWAMGWYARILFGGSDRSALRRLLAE